MTDLGPEFQALLRKVESIKGRAGVNAMRSAGRKAVRPVMVIMRAQIPKGTQAHRTWKGRLVAPGFASRSIRTITKINRVAGSVSTIIGVRKEAFYAPQFYDQGPYTISTRRRSIGRKSRAKTAIRPYTLQRRPWFQSVFIAQRSNMEAAYADHLRAEIEKAARNG